MSDKTPLQSVRIHGPMSRRTFVVVASSAALAATLPLAAPVSEAASALRTSETDWDVDDMFVGFPRYAQPIGYAPPPRTQNLFAHVDPADVPFLV